MCVEESGWNAGWKRAVTCTTPQDRTYVHHVLVQPVDVHVGAQLIPAAGTEEGVEVLAVP
jgi:hypothetical protein